MATSAPPSDAAVGLPAAAPRLIVTAVSGLPVIAAGDALATAVIRALRAQDCSLADGDVLVVASKVVSRAEDRFVDLTTITPSPQAAELATRVDKDPRLVELVLQESDAISRAVPGVLIARHRLGVVSANAGIDASNAVPCGARAGSGPWVLLWPPDPDASARALRDQVRQAAGARVAVIISDSLGRPFRLGTVGHALGSAGLTPLIDHRGRPDLFGRPLEYTETAPADALAAAADLLAGQSGEARPLVHIRGLHLGDDGRGADALVRPADRDLYA